MKIAVVIPALNESARVAEAVGSALTGAQRAERPHPNAIGSKQIGSAAEALASMPLEASIGASIGASVETSTRAEWVEAEQVEAEVVVVDGGSRDDTCQRAQAAGARVVASEPGRAKQLDSGVRATTGDPILFLHADTRLPVGWKESVARALADPRVAGGAFSLRYSEGERALRIVEWGARLRVWLFGLPYGDQALFVRRDVLARIGGVPQVRLMEDLDLVRAIKRHGRLARLSPAVETSGRRYLEHGVWRTMGRHGIAALAWKFGVDRERVAGWVGR